MALMSPRVGPCSGVAATGRRGAWRWPGRRWRAPLRGAQTVRCILGSIGAESATAPSPLFWPDLVALTPYTKRKRRQARAQTGDQVHPTLCFCQLDYDMMSFISPDWGMRQPDAQKAFLVPTLPSPRPSPVPLASIFIGFSLLLISARTRMSHIRPASGGQGPPPYFPISESAYPSNSQLRTRY